jgi:hypothetical protein
MAKYDADEANGDDDQRRTHCQNPTGQAGPVSVAVSATVIMGVLLRRDVGVITH